MVSQVSFIFLFFVLFVVCGRYFAYDQFSRAPDLYTDAAKERRHTGGGYFSTCGAFVYWKFGASTSRQPIDYLEGFAVLQAAEDIGHTWKNKIVPVWIDNSAFERSLYKGRSKAPRLNILLRKLFLLSVKFSCVFEPHWLASKDNGAADALSRGDHGRFLVGLKPNLIITAGVNTESTSYGCVINRRSR